MILAETWENARKGRLIRDLPIFRGARNNYIVSSPEARPAPQAFLIEQDPGVVLQAHFHSEPQFQVVAAGRGAVGAHEVRPFAIHYTSEHSPYGPISASDEGVWYFTFRAVTNEGAFWMPEQRAELRRDGRRVQVTVDSPPISDPKALAQRSANSVETLIEPQEGGLAAWLVRMAPHQTQPAPQAAHGGGRYYLVAEGALLIGGKPYPKLAAAWVSAEEEPFNVNAGVEGLEVLVLQFPSYACRSDLPPASRTKLK